MTPPTQKPILCGTDFSENASQAGAAAAALARLWKKPLVLVHVADELNAHAETREDLERFLRPVRERLQTEESRMAALGTTVTGELLHGRIAERALLDFAIDHPAELLVVSAVSKSPFDRWTLGSVSERVAEEAPEATLVVRAAAPFEAWARGERPLKVFVAMDFSPSAEAAVRWAGALRNLGACELTVGFVNWPPEDCDRLGLPARQTFFENPPEVQSVLERDVREKVAALLGDEPIAVRVHASWGRADLPLIDLACIAQADLLVVGTHQRHGLSRARLGSVSRGILRHAPMNVACVPTAAAPAARPAIRPCRRVLAAADLTEHGGLALPYAYSVVAEGGTVTLFHVNKGGPPHSDAAADGAAHLRTLIPPDAETHGIHTEIRIVEGDDASRAICQAAESFNADLVCIGAHARPGAATRVMGSVALAVLRHCRRPVLVVWSPDM